MSSATVLIVEDDADIRRIVRMALAAEGHKVVESGTAHRGAIDAATHKADLAIIDLGLPDGDGLELIRKLRAWSAMPLIVLSARTREDIKIAALDAGADDYVTKPFGVGELAARVRVALRKPARLAADAGRLGLGAARLDLALRKAWRGDDEVHLTPLEFKLVACLARRLGMVVTHRELLTEVWGPSHAEHTHYLRIYLKQLRDKLEADPAQPRHFITETGIGYRLVADEAD